MEEKIAFSNENTTPSPIPDYISEIVEIVRSRLTPKLMRDRVLDYHENDIASALELLNREEREKLYRILDAETLANILEYAENRNEYISELGMRKRADVLSEFEAATAVDYLREMSKEDRNTLIEWMPEETKRELMLLNSFDEDEIGSKMTTNYICIREGITIREAMRDLVDQAAENDNISTIYVTDQEGLLVGAVDLKDLIIARRDTDLASITMTSYPYVYAHELIEDCIERLKDYSEDSIPVLDSENRLKGVLTSQDLTQLVDDEMGEDYAKLAGLSAEEDLREPLKKSIGKRLPWLVILLGFGLVVSSVVGVFESVVAQIAILVSFQSLILDMSGNVGTQSLAVTIRVLMDEKLSKKQKLFLVGKEARVGLTNGLILGSLSFALVWAYLFLLKKHSLLFAFSVAGCTGTALLVSILLSSVSGTVIPLIFKKMKLDPAVASGPLITTLNDLIAVVTYYGLSALFLLNILHLAG